MEIRLHLVVLFAVLLLAVHISYADQLFTCDVDLVSTDGTEFDRPWVPSFLNDFCLEKFNQRLMGSIYPLLDQEANAFKAFIIAIERYEAKISGKAVCANRKYALNINERQKFYKQVDLCLCYKKNNYETFLNCLTKKRLELANLINNAGN